MVFEVNNVNTGHYAMKFLTGNGNQKSVQKTQAKTSNLGSKVQLFDQPNHATNKK